MDSQPAGIDFALIGHQDSWEKINCFVNHLNESSRSIPVERIPEIYSYIPARNIFDIAATSITGKKIYGCYIETFISPDELEQKFWKKNVIKVKEAAACARQLNSKISSLGGFTSIVLEGRNDTLNNGSSTKFTTGNSLTAAFIVKSLEKACKKYGKDLNEQKLLVIGATGDIGSACVNYFTGKVNTLLLCARQNIFLEEMEISLSQRGQRAKASTDLGKLLPYADLIISIASSLINEFDASLCKKNVIICDAGYPKNLFFINENYFNDRLFCGGMGYIKGGFELLPETNQHFYQFPVKNVAHGCMLEGLVLAFEKLHIPFSAGRGNISPEKIDIIYSLALKHGISEAPFFNPVSQWR